MKVRFFKYKTTKDWNEDLFPFSSFRSAFFWFLLLIFPFFGKRSIIPVVLFSTKPWRGYHWYNCRSVYQLAWENSRHWFRDEFPTFHIDDGWVTTQIKQELHWKLKISFNQSETCTTQWWRCKMSAVFSGYVSIYRGRVIPVLRC